MRFILGVITGFAAGTAAAMLTSGKTGDELRLEFDRIRSDIQQRDFEALGSHLEERFKDLQASLETRLSQAGASAQEAVDDLSETLESAADDAADTVDDLAEEQAPA
jgi:gas vesicle protein